MNDRLEQVKWAFYLWLGALSIDEVLGNRALMESAECVEQHLKKVKA